MEILWTAPAEAHLRAIRDFHERTSPPYARRIVDRITERTKTLRQFPYLGAVIPEAENLGLRSLVEGDYRILYAVGADHIHILGVLHGSRGSL